MSQRTSSPGKRSSPYWRARKSGSFLHPDKPRSEYAADLAQLRVRLAYNPETGVFTLRKAQNGRRADAPLGGLTSAKYLRISVGHGVYFRAHRLAWIYVHGQEPPGEIDHINGNRTDNRLANLRCVSRTENCHNIRNPKKNNRSGFLGVTEYRNGRHGVSYKATIAIGGFATPKEAHAAYLKAKRLLHTGFCDG